MVWQFKPDPKKIGMTVRAETQQLPLPKSRSTFNKTTDDFNEQTEPPRSGGLPEHLVVPKGHSNRFSQLHHDYEPIAA